MSDWLPLLFQGLPVTVQVVAGGIVVALVMAFSAGLACSARSAWLRWPARIYIEFFRGTSALVQLFWFAYALPVFMGILLPGLLVGIVVLGLNLGAYGAEVVRGALRGVPQGQREAALALGLSPAQCMVRITLPQAMPAMLPSLGNQMIELLKASALVTFISLEELMWAAWILRGAEPGSALGIYGLVMVYYAVLALSLAGLVRVFEWRGPRRLLGRVCLWVITPLLACGPGLARLPAGWWRFTRYSLLLTVLILTGLLVRRGLAIWDWSFVGMILPDLLGRGLPQTILATCGAAALALVLGLFWAGLRQLRWIGPVVWLISEAIRSTPPLAQLFLLFYGALPALGLQVPPLLVGMITLGLHYSTYTAEVYRAAIRDIPAGQREAAQALGLHPLQCFLRIIIPQALPRALPALGNYVIVLFKESPLLMTITVMELMGFADEFASDHYRSVEPYTIIGIIFLLLSLGAATGIRQVERLLPVRHA